MSIQNAANRIEYAGNASTVVAYPIPFRFDSSAWLNVTRYDANGSYSLLTIGVGYTLLTNSLTTTVAVASDSRLIISRYTPAFQTLSLLPNSPLPAADLEAALDRTMMALQDRDTNGGLPFARALTFPTAEPTTHATQLPLPHLRKDTFPYFNSTTGEMTLLSKPSIITLFLPLVLPIFKGNTGNTGPQGTTGVTGAAGTNGATGATGATGAAGAAGANGANGIGLPTGANGQMAYHNGTNWVTLANPGVPAAATANILLHNGTSPSWVNKIIKTLDICEAGVPVTIDVIKF